MGICAILCPHLQISGGNKLSYIYMYTYCKIFDFLNRQSYSIFSPDTSFVHWNICSIFDDF